LHIPNDAERCAKLNACVSLGILYTLTQRKKSLFTAKQCPEKNKEFRKIAVLFAVFIRQGAMDK